MNSEGEFSVSRVSATSWKWTSLVMNEDVLNTSATQSRRFSSPRGVRGGELRANI